MTKEYAEVITTTWTNASTRQRDTALYMAGILPPIEVPRPANNHLAEKQLHIFLPDPKRRRPDVKTVFTICPKAGKAHHIMVRLL